MASIGLGLGMALAGVGSAAGAGISALGANAAAGTQADAATAGANLQAQTAQNNLQFQGNALNAQISNTAPWYQAGEGALGNLEYLMGIQPGAAPSGVSVPQWGSGGATSPGVATPLPNNDSQHDGLGVGTPLTAVPRSTGGLSAPPGTAGLTSAGVAPTAVPGQAAGSLIQPWTQTFQAPTNVTEQNDPGFQFRLQQGQQALERSAAAAGNLFTGGTGKALEQFGQEQASNEYSNVYNRALQGYQTNYNTFENNQTNSYNRLANLAGMGQTSAQQLNAATGNTAANVGATMSNTANAIAQQGNNAAAARGSGYTAMANAGAGAFSGLGNTASQYGLLQTLMNNGGGGLPSAFNASGNYVNNEGAVYSPTAVTY